MVSLKNYKFFIYKEFSVLEGHPYYKNKFNKPKNSHYDKSVYRNTRSRDVLFDSSMYRTLRETM